MRSFIFIICILTFIATMSNGTNESDRVPHPGIPAAQMHENERVQPSIMMYPTSVSKRVLGCYIYGFAILPS